MIIICFSEVSSPSVASKSTTDCRENAPGNEASDDDALVDRRKRQPTFLCRSRKPVAINSRERTNAATPFQRFCHRYRYLCETFYRKCQWPMQCKFGKTQYLLSSSKYTSPNKSSCSTARLPSSLYFLHRFFDQFIIRFITLL